MSVIGYISAAAAITWSPAADRRVTLPSASSSSSGTRGVSKDLTVGLPQKDISTAWEYSIDLSAQIAKGDTVVAVNLISISPAGIAVLYKGGWGQLAVFWVGRGGDLGQVYSLALSVNTAQARTIGLLATIQVPGLTDLPSTVTVVSVSSSYVDDAVATVATSAERARAIASAASVIADAATVAAANAVQVTGAAMTGNLGLKTIDTLVGAGTMQDTATLLDAQLCIFTSFPVSTGAILPTAAQVGTLAPVTVRNKDAANAGQVYPPDGGQIDSYGVNQPVSIAPGGEINFIPGSTPGQWWA